MFSSLFRTQFCSLCAIPICLFYSLPRTQFLISPPPPPRSVFSVILFFAPYSVLLSLLHTQFCFPPCFILSLFYSLFHTQFCIAACSRISFVLLVLYSFFDLLPASFSVPFSSLLRTQFCSPCSILSFVFHPIPYSVFFSSLLHTQFCHPLLQSLFHTMFFSLPCSVLSFVLLHTQYSVLFSI